MRDYLAGSRMVSFLIDAAKRFFRLTAPSRSRMAAWTALSGPQAFCAFVAAAVAANGLTLWLSRKPVMPWGVALRAAVLVVALAVLRTTGEWDSLREKSFLAGWIRRKNDRC